MDFGVYKPELRELLDEAMYGPLAADQIRQLPLHTRCRLIRHMTAKLLARKQVDWNTLTANSLERLCKSFDISDHYVEWQEKRADILLRQMKRKENKSTLNVFRHWSHSSDAQCKEAIRATARIHQRVFAEGVATLLPVAHVFVLMQPRRNNGQTNMFFSTFSSSLETGKGRIRQNTHPWVFGNAHAALDSAHHEMSHAIHFSLAVEYHRRRIRPDHPLHDDARYFHAAEVYKAGVPPSIPSVYNAQTFEVLAAREGASIGKRIYELAL